MSAATVLSVAEMAWRWVLDQVRDDHGPWIPETVPDGAEPPEGRDGLHSGIAGLAHVLAEVRATRAWTDEEEALAAAITGRLLDEGATATAYDYFDGLAGWLGAVVTLGTAERSDAEALVRRLLDLAESDGWQQEHVLPPRFAPGARINDATLGTASVLLAAVWARRHAVPRSEELCERAALILMSEEETTPDGPRWRFVPRRFRTEDQPTEMPNWSHGQAGIAAALALAGAELGRPSWIDAAAAGAEGLVAMGGLAAGGFTVPRYVPHTVPDEDPVTFGWCHGASGTSLLFAALEHAGVATVAGASPERWRRRCLEAVRASGVPERLRPGFWDNDGRCCGTTGVADIVLDAWQRHGHDADLAFGTRLTQALVQRAEIEGDHAWWRFVEHRAVTPLLPPGVGWMQGAAGIAAYLFRASRVLEQGRSAVVVPRLDSWWAGP